MADPLRCSNKPMGAVMLYILFVCFAGNQQKEHKVMDAEPAKDLVFSPEVPTAHSGW